MTSGSPNFKNSYLNPISFSFCLPASVFITSALLTAQQDCNADNPDTLPIQWEEILKRWKVEYILAGSCERGVGEQCANSEHPGRLTVG